MQKSGLWFNSNNFNYNTIVVNKPASAKNLNKTYVNDLQYIMRLKLKITYWSVPWSTNSEPNQSINSITDFPNTTKKTVRILDPREIWSWKISWETTFKSHHLKAKWKWLFFLTMSFYFIYGLGLPLSLLNFHEVWVSHWTLNLFKLVIFDA